MMMSPNGNIFRVTALLCGEFTGHLWFPAQRPVARSIGVLLDLHPNKRLSKQSWGCWFVTLFWPLWRHRNVFKDTNRRYRHDWGWLFIPLPDGKHQVIFHAEAGPGAGIMIDDLRISSCEFLCELVIKINKIMRNWLESYSWYMYLD